MIHVLVSFTSGSTVCSCSAMLSLQVTVRVLDANDSLPVFVSSVRRFTVSENQTAPVTVGTVPATDRDEGT